MAPQFAEMIEFAKPRSGMPLRCRIEASPGRVCLFIDGGEITFDFGSDSLERAIQYAETMGYERVTPRPAG